MFNIEEKLRYNKPYQWTKDKIRNTKYGVGNLVTWIPVIWKDRWWDSYFIYPILHKKLSIMEHNIRYNGHLLNSEKDADKIKVCVVLLKRIMDNNYDESAFKKHYEKWGHSEMTFIPTDNPNLSEMKIDYDNVVTEKDKVQERKDFKRAIEHEDMLKKQDIDFLFKTISKQISSWWD